MDRQYSDELERIITDTLMEMSNISEDDEGPVSCILCVEEKIKKWRLYIESENSEIGSPPDVLFEFEACPHTEWELNLPVNKL